MNSEDGRLTRGAADPRGRATEKERLLDALLSEARLLDTLSHVLRDQRNGVAKDDLEAVDESVYAAQRILLTVAEARRRRRSLMQLLGGVADVSLDDLERAIGPLMDDEIRRARSELESAARRLAAELDINRRVLQSAIRTGETYVRALYGAAGEQGAYSSDAGQNAQSGAGLLMNRQV